MKAAVGFIALGIVILFMGGIMWALGQFRGVSFQEPHIQATGGGVTSVNIVLANKVLDDSTTNITVLSNNVADAPVPFAYASTNRQLTINGLNASDTRTLTITYQVPRLDDMTDILARYFPTFMILGCVITIIGICVVAWQSRQG